MLPTSRKQAKLLNERYYFTGKKCPKNHISKRYTHNGVCYDCVMESNKKWYDNNKLDIEWRKKRLFNHLKNRAMIKNIPFDLEYSDIEWNDICPVFGCKLQYDSTETAKNDSASIDKIFPELGYVKGNVRVISHRANWLKQDATIEQLENIIRYMKEQQN